MIDKNLYYNAEYVGQQTDLDSEERNERIKQQKAILKRKKVAKTLLCFGVATAAMVMTVLPAAYVIANYDKYGNHSMPAGIEVEQPIYADEIEDETEALPEEDKQAENTQNETAQKQAKTVKPVEPAR